MCTTFSTRNRAVLLNKYAVTTVLVNPTAYCPYGPNHQDYSRRSRLYNPDPKYQCHSDLTCHQFDSMPKQPCGEYGTPQPQFNCCGGGAPSSTIPCTSPTGACYPPNDQDCPMGRPRLCQRRKIKPPSCCKSRSTYKDLIDSFQCCVPLPPCPPCCPCPSNDDQEPACDEQNDEESEQRDPSCYSVVVPPEMGDCCGSKVTYNFGPTGISRSVETRNGCNQICMPCQDDCVLLETCGGPGGCCVGNSGMRVNSKCSTFSCLPPSCCPPPCCPPPCCNKPELCCLPPPPPPCCLPACPPPRCCSRPCPPPPCLTRKRIRCSPFLRTTVGPDIGCGCQSMVFRPRFRCP